MRSSATGALSAGLVAAGGLGRLGGGLLGWRLLGGGLLGWRLLGGGLLGWRLLGGGLLGWRLLGGGLLGWRLLGGGLLGWRLLGGGPLGRRLLGGGLLRLLGCFLDAADHEEGLLRQVVALAVHYVLETPHSVGQWHVLAGHAGELLGDVEGLREEALDLAGALDHDLVLVGELVHAQDGDDVLQLAVALEDLLYADGDLVVFVADRVPREDARRGVERVYRRIDALLHDGAREDRGRVEVRERGGRRRVGEVVGRHVDGLHRRHRAALRGGDALLQLAHLVGEGGLVAHGARHAAEESGDLGARLHEAEDVVDEEQHVLADLLAEVLGYGEAGEADAQTRARRLVHLTEDERRLVDDARLLHVEPEVVALARALADAAEHGQAAVLRGDVADELLHDDRLTHAGAAEEADLAALHVRSDEVDDLDAGLEDLVRGVQRLEIGRRAMDRPALHVGQRLAVVDRVADDVDKAAERLLAHRHRHGLAGVDDVGAAREAVGGVHGDGPHLVVAEVLLHLADDLFALAVAVADPDLEGVVNGRDLVWEPDVDHRADDLDHCACVHNLNSALRV